MLLGNSRIMKQYLPYFSPETHPHLNHLMQLAENLDKGIQSHELIFVNEEGFMERHPRPSERVKNWAKEYANRKEFFSETERQDWLTAERDRFLQFLDHASQAEYLPYFRAFLRVISQEKGAKIDANPPDAFTGIKEEVIELVMNNQLEKALTQLEDYLETQPSFQEYRNELILHIAGLREYEAKERQNLLDAATISREKARIRAALLDVINQLT